VYELPVERTAETGREVNQSCGKGGSVVPLALSDTEPSIVQHDNADCEQFEGEVEQGLSVPGNEVSSNESVENATDVNGEEILYTDPAPTEWPQSGIQPDDTPRRPARAAARPSRFRDDQFETEFRPGPRKNKVRQVHLNPGKGEPTAVQERQPPYTAKDTRETRVSDSQRRVKWRDTG